jgi:hypothetical protein
MLDGLPMRVYHLHMLKQYHLGRLKTIEEETTMTLTKEESRQVAQTIFTQLGGYRFAAMTGAKHFVFDTDGSLSFKLPGGKFNHVRIELTPMDVYKVIFTKYRALNTVRQETRDMVYDTDLQPVFTAVTGLHTRL